jgi:glycosyltransferase involved in cell wall biosynthesis
VKVLIVAPGPGRRDGIGAYAGVQAGRLRTEGHEAELLEAAHGGSVLREAARRAPSFGRVIVHFQPTLYHPPRRPWGKVAASLGLLALVRKPNVEVVVHEADAPIAWRPDHALLRRAFRDATKLVFHTEAERRALAEAYRFPVRGEVVPHADGISVHGVGREAARGRLGLGSDAPVFVCPGFIHPDKGFDRAVEALAETGGGSLHVVGSVRDPLPANVAYASRLRELCARTPGAALHEGFVSDEELDAWIAAADAVVLPYRRSWSSGMLARAQLLGTPAIVSRMGGLPEQAGEADTVIEDDEELAGAMRAVLASSATRTDRRAR